MLIGDQVREVLVGLGFDRAALVGPARLDDDLGLDSLSLTEVLLALEDELAISIPDPVQAQLRTVDDLLAVVGAQIGGSPAVVPSGAALGDTLARQLPAV